jgi:hypothetical protein
MTGESTRSAGMVGGTAHGEIEWGGDGGREIQLVSLLFYDSAPALLYTYTNFSNVGRSISRHL